MTEFVIFYEHRTRELESVCLLKEELCRRGYRVRVANTLFWRAFSTFLFYRPEVLVVPWLYGDREVAFFNNFRVPVHKIVNLQCEQIYTPYDREDPKIYPQGAAKKAFHVCWGEKEMKYLAEAGIPENKLLLTGAVSMDMDRPMFHSFFLPRHELAQKYGLDETRPWNLFISSFSYVGLSDERLEEIKQVFPFAFELADISRETRDILLAWFEEYAVSHPETVFIYRPHPGERKDRKLAALERRVRNFRVIAEESVRQWIFCCDKINNWYSTSINDVCFLGKNSSTLRPVFIPTFMDNEELTQEKFITTYEEFERFNESENKGPSEELIKIVRQYYRYDETPAYIKLADSLEEILHGCCGEDFSKCRGSYRRDPLWKRARMALFVWLFAYVPGITGAIRSRRRTPYVERIRRECFQIREEYKETSRKMQRIINRKNLRRRCR